MNNPDYKVSKTGNSIFYTVTVPPQPSKNTTESKKLGHTFTIKNGELNDDDALEIPSKKDVFNTPLQPNQPSNLSKRSISERLSSRLNNCASKIIKAIKNFFISKFTIKIERETHQKEQAMEKFLTEAKKLKGNLTEAEETLLKDFFDAIGEINFQSLDKEFSMLESNHLSTDKIYNICNLIEDVRSQQLESINSKKGALGASNPKTEELLNLFGGLQGLCKMIYIDDRAKVPDLMALFSSLIEYATPTNSQLLTDLIHPKSVLYHEGKLTFSTATTDRTIEAYEDAEQNEGIRKGFIRRACSDLFQRMEWERVSLTKENIFESGICKVSFINPQDKVTEVEVNLDLRSLGNNISRQGVKLIFDLITDVLNQTEINNYKIPEEILQDTVEELLGNKQDEQTQQDKKDQLNQIIMNFASKMNAAYTIALLTAH